MFQCFAVTSSIIDGDMYYNDCFAVFQTTCGENDMSRQQELKARSRRLCKKCICFSMATGVQSCRCLVVNMLMGRYCGCDDITYTSSSPLTP